ncbi:LPXTG cell wall anchor domain-containing protein, partial [Microbacterium sp. P07]|uniref:LPXTG cell wall anchor domain-containing protein n=1 Tax=Microbacterium sp. P07 TaxID=3366952 RepID=UPI003746D66D
PPPPLPPPPSPPPPPPPATGTDASAMLPLLALSMLTLGGVFLAVRTRVIRARKS